MALFIRPYQNQDYDQVIALWKDTGVYATKRGDSPESIRSCQDQGAHFLVLEDAGCGKIRGTVWLTWDGRRWFLHHLAVGPEIQERGWGKKLAEAALDLARERSAPVKLEVHRDNAAALKIYRDLGFEVFEDYYVFMHEKP